MHELPPDTLMITIFKRIIAGDVLSNKDLKESQRILFNMAMDHNTKPKDFKLLIKKFRQSIPNFLTKLEKELREVEEVSESLFDTYEAQMKWIKTKPMHAESHDAPEMVQFIRSLDKEYYSFSEAEKLVGVSRQTLKKYAKDGSHGLKEHPAGKVTKLHKPEIINFYREKYFKDYDPFAPSKF